MIFVIIKFKLEDYIQKRRKVEWRKLLHLSYGRNKLKTVVVCFKIYFFMGISIIVMILFLGKCGNIIPIKCPVEVDLLFAPGMSQINDKTNI